VGPWSFATILASDCLTWAVREASKEGVNCPAAVYLDRLAERVGMTRAQFFRILAGDRVPTIPQLVQLCQTIGSARAIAVLAEDCGLSVDGQAGPGAAETPGASRASRAA
jgi:hypothetical protein